MRELLLEPADVTGMARSKNFGSFGIRETNQEKETGCGIQQTISMSPR